MKLSEAILLGSVGSIQAGCPPDDEPNNSDGFACALEAACVAIGWTKDRWIAVSEMWPWVNKQFGYCPHCQVMMNGMPYKYEEIIWHLNDTHHWTRPRIAAFVATIEPQDAPVVVKATSEVVCEA